MGVLVDYSLRLDLIPAFIDLFHNGFVVGRRASNRLLMHPEWRNFWKFSVMASNGLHQSAQVGARDSKDKRPVLLWV